MVESLPADVLLLCAGFGERLRPITDKTPKPLVQVAGRTLLERNLELIARAGFKRVFLNLHYLPEQIREFVGNGQRWGLEAILVEELEILDTGGAIKNIEPLLVHDTLLTINCDILIDPAFPLKEVVQEHLNNSELPLITMVLRHEPEAKKYGEIGINDSGRVVKFLGVDYGIGSSTDCLMFLGIEVMNNNVLKLMPERGSKFSITRDSIKKILLQKGLITSYVFDGYWSDIGTAQRLEQASKDWVRIFGVS